MLDMETIIGVGVTLAGVGGGIGLIVLTENAGKRNDDVSNQQVCVVDDWDAGEKEVVMFSDILADYPVKASDQPCQRCAGRGVNVCDNCDGSGIQPRFLERYSPDDFMD